MPSEASTHDLIEIDLDTDLTKIPDLRKARWPTGNLTPEEAKIFFKLASEMLRRAVSSVTIESMIEHDQRIADQAGRVLAAEAAERAAQRAARNKEGE